MSIIRKRYNYAQKIELVLQHISGSHESVSREIITIFCFPTLYILYRKKMVPSGRLLILLLVAPILLVTPLRFDLGAGKTKVCINCESTILSERSEAPNNLKKIS